MHLSLIIFVINIFVLLNSLLFFFPLILKLNNNIYFSQLIYVMIKQNHTLIAKIIKLTYTIYAIYFILHNVIININNLNKHRYTLKKSQ